MSRIMASVQLLGEPVKDGGVGDEQAMRILLLVATTGRRLSEILLLDRDPLLPLHGIARAAGEEGFVAKLRYQQTKIEDGPNTILIDPDTVAVIRAQQEWADREMAARGLPGVVPALPVHRPANEQGRAPALPGRDPAQSAAQVRRARRPARRPRPPAPAQPHPQLPSHPRDQPDQRRRAAARGPALLRAPVTDDDDALRPDQRRDPATRVPALQEDHRRRPRARARPH